MIVSLGVPVRSFGFEATGTASRRYLDMHPRLEQILRAGTRSGTTRPLPETADGEPAAPELVLRVVDEGRELRLVGEVTCGRDPANDLVLDDPSVSARHFLLLAQPRSSVLYDCHSRNGTFVNGTRVRCAEIAPGALIVAGRSHLRAASPPQGGPPPEPKSGLIGQSPALIGMLGQLERIARTPLAVLLLGESGTGKELAARAIHALSPRANGPFVPVNCAGIADDVAESELFGHERGAFTGALTSHPGVFEEASGGTLFLDEVGDLPLRLQPKLLRALEQGTVRRVGGRGEVRVQVRVVSATHRDLAAGGFRLDLYHRLARAVLQLPALRDRPEDIPLLAEHFLLEIARAETRVPQRFAPCARAALQSHDWPGNVRELRNVVERAALLASGPILTAEDVRCELPARPPARDERAPIDDLVAGRTLGEIERDAIAAALRRTAGNQRAAAALLGLPRSTLADRARRFGLLP
jgi:DNA-binding NtrC family response regulator